MKKILFVINNLETGGVQKSLLNLLTEIHRQYDITLLTFWGNRAFEAQLPENVRLIKAKGPFRQLGLSAAHTKGHPFWYLERVFWMALTKLFGRSFAIQCMCVGRRRYGDYDVAISFIHEAPQNVLYGGCNEFVLKMVRADKKLGWLHCDFAQSGANNAKSARIYAALDGVVACSEGCRRSFAACLPTLAHKAVTVRNCNEYAAIRALAGDGIAYDGDRFHIVTVARLAEEKGIERMLTAVAEAKARGFAVQYHLVGDGSMRGKLEAMAAELDLSDSVTFYGNQPNPYPYIKNADLFVLPSYHEAAPMVFDEAACLGVPVLATATTSPDDMITAAGAGFVCDNTQEALTAALLDMLADPAPLKHIAAQLAARPFDNEAARQALAAVL